MMRNVARCLLLLMLLLAASMVHSSEDKKKLSKEEKITKKKLKVTVGPEKQKRKKESHEDEDREDRKERKKKEKEEKKLEKKEDKELKKKIAVKKKIGKVERKEAFKKAQTKPRTILADRPDLTKKTLEKLERHKRLNRKEKTEVAKVELQKYKQLRQKGFSEVSNTKEAAMMRDYRLRNKKRAGLFRKKEASLSQILFPGVSPEDYNFREPIWIYTDMVESRLSPVPFDVYDLPGYIEEMEDKRIKRFRLKRNLGSRLQGHDLKPAPFKLRTKDDVPCTIFGKSYMNAKTLRWVRQLVERQYRVHLQLDGLPVLLKSTELNFALRGYPVGFKLPNSKELYLYNHLKFTVTYHENPNMFQGARITGFEVHPVSIKHERLTGNTAPTCQGFNVENKPDTSTFVSLEMNALEKEPIVFSYDVKWVENKNLEWTDRWDVYLIGAPDDEIHYYSIINSFMIVMVMTGAIATIMVRTLRKDIAGYNELSVLEEGEEETGWKLVHGDVFRPPSFSPMLLSVFVGTGSQIGIAGFCAILLSIAHVTNALKKGQMLTSLIFCYALAGSVAGYISASTYKFADGKSWKLNTLLTATALPSVGFSIFAMLNIFLSRLHAATAVSFWTVLFLFLIWVCIATPLVFAGSFVALRGKGIEASIKTNSIARIIPGTLWSVAPVVTCLIGGILPFGSVCIELAFIMSALWLHQIYYVMGFLLAVGLILYMTCAQVSIVMCYLQLCAEDHRWWWKSFWNCATSGVYLFLYSIWFLVSKMHMVGKLPVIIYLTYMGLISVCLGLTCGAAGFLSSLWFTKKIYGSVKLD